MTITIPADWRHLDSTRYGDDMVEFDGKWFAKYDDTPSRIIGRPFSCLTYQHMEYTSEGVSDHRILVAEDHTAKYN